MKRTKMFLRSRGALLAIVVVALGSVLGLLTPPDIAQSAVCAFRPITRNYYSDATYTNLVGQRGIDCNCNEFSWGITTAYVKNTTQCCPYFTC